MRVAASVALTVLACGESRPAEAPIVVAEVAPASSSATPAAAEPSPPPTTSATATATEEDLSPDAGNVLRSHVTRSPSLRQGQVSITGKLPAEVVQRIVRQNFGRFRICYESGLRKEPTLGGTATVKFTIDPKGAVTKASEGPSDLGDKDVIACLVQTVSKLSFPQPPSGVVVVVYPIIFNPGE